MTALPARRRPVSLRGETHRDVVPRGLPGVGIVLGAPRRRMALDLHSAAPGTPRWRSLADPDAGSDTETAGASRRIGLLDNFKHLFNISV